MWLRNSHPPCHATLFFRSERRLDHNSQQWIVFGATSNREFWGGFWVALRVVNGGGFRTNPGLLHAYQAGRKVSSKAVRALMGLIRVPCWPIYIIGRVINLQTGCSRSNVQINLPSRHAYPRDEDIIFRCMLVEGNKNKTRCLIMQ